MPSKLMQVTKNNRQLTSLKLPGAEYPYRERRLRAFPETGGIFKIFIFTVLPENKAKLNSQKHFRGYSARADWPAFHQ
jgi:hypothetical protein